MKTTQILVAMACAAVAVEEVNAGYVYIGTGGDPAAMTQWCNWNCPGYCPPDLCRADGGSNPTAAPTPNNPTPGPGTSAGFSRFLSEAKFKELFPQAIWLYTFSNLVEAAKKYPAFANTGNELNDKRELAAFLAQTAHESDYFKAAEEYAKDSYPVTQYCNPSQVPCAPGKRYHGRGPMQLSWNYNYNAAGRALGIDLLNNPDLVSSDKSITWQTALWYWMTPQKAGRIIHDVVTRDDGFAQSTDIINGGMECGPSAPYKYKELQRIEYYKRICSVFGVQPVARVSCN
ncbi:hypothetical protein Poli38472_014402 [Pythium oligandrum]|uniref:Glycoside hydrolase family 19 catalytic domain-containing protein n=1 Tax=Pythium oligandrum TaxID=41045 RepID=A0A8K1C7B3_PYTOL|nr:hypothetical protein Poli38472_014402 [Pythium oligandrum]|eukprot:TMW57799.1 hypothetical protein Poli38472_014402 [Pythium oligandrum]